ncbi:MAG TPA: hypothetical protein VF077_09605 [Nitrospiraceae bacterium]
MGRITKKSRSVKRQKTGKPVPRYVIRKDSRNRRYAVDKRTGKRVTIVKAEKERQKLKKTTQQFRGIKPKKAPKTPKKPQKTAKDRSAAAKKGWETRKVKQRAIRTAKKAKALADLTSGKRTAAQIHESELPTPVPIVNQLGALIPEGMRMRTVDGLADRIELYPKVKAAAESAWTRLQRDSYGHQFGEGPTMAGSQFDRDHGKGMGDYIRYQVFARARDLQDIEQLIEDILDTDDDYSARELYGLYFSPEVA